MPFLIYSTEMQLNARSVALVAVFAAVAISLNAIRIPAIFWPGLAYPLSEIPIVIAFLLYDFKIATLVGVINLAGQLLFFQLGPGSIVGYPMGFLALLVTLSGMYIATRLMFGKVTPEKPLSERKKATIFTAFAMAFRTAIMPFSDYAVFYGILLPLVGISIPDAYRAALIPAFILFNIMVPLYTVPIAYVVGTKVSAHFKNELLA
jgi:riboflavin transporter FmnP